jgi:hypothetical protein
LGAWWPAWTPPPPVECMWRSSTRVRDRDKAHAIAEIFPMLFNASRGDVQHLPGIFSRLEIGGV